jgi:hypothetical protein
MILAQQYENSKEFEKAIGVYNNLLGSISKERFPYEYAKIKLKLGKDYGLLSDSENKEINLLHSRDSLIESLTIFTYEKYPGDYAAAQQNLGIMYQQFSEIRNQHENNLNSIIAFNSALPIFKSVYLTR